ncbi:response regulator transcription factor [Leptolyngbya sp. FACHB-261]|uniref:response regulator transcription factor n=1 Tax=Leptolyngbya sp. FACHB-261 TaxID=2692806 RepID=UPI001687B52A|nr:response regulator [Leptolyngbya sp. FACHB-261]MBD2102307.1 response regulator [Leptolyngbya sp. FACHB-261]
MNTVLLVEDSLTDAELMSRYLKQLGISVVCVRSGEEAISKLGFQKPDLIVLDVILPGQSGFELCRELKKNPVTSQIPVVMCSTKSTEVDRIWGNMLGADAYLPKPVDPQQLLTVVRQLIKL